MKNSQSISRSKVMHNQSIIHSKNFKQNNLSSQPTLQDKLSAAKHINQKLTTLFNSLKTNTHIKNLSHSNSSSLVSNRQKVQSKKMTQKLQMEVQHLKHLQNLILSENKKLKQEVNNRRKQRVIYSNIFKKYQKDIRIWEDKYKECLLDNLATQDAEKKVRDKINKLKRKFQKEIKQLEQIKAEKQAEKKMAEMEMVKQVTKNVMVFNGAKVNGMNLDSSGKLINSSKRTVQAGQSYKRLVSQKQLQIKVKQHQAEYQKQSKNIIFQSLAQQLKKISQTQQLTQAVQLFKTIDQKTQEIYQKYSQLQKFKKQKEQKIHDLQATILLKQSISIRGTSKTIESKQSEETNLLDEKIREEREKVAKLEAELSKKLDINCRKLDNQQLKPFIQRIVVTRSNQDAPSKENCQQKATDSKESVENRTSSPFNRSHINYNSTFNSTSNKNSPSSTQKHTTLPSSKHHARKQFANGSSQKGVNMKNLLQRKLEQIQKQKTVDNYLLTYNQINKAMLKHYINEKPSMQNSRIIANNQTSKN